MGLFEELSAVAGEGNVLRDAPLSGYTSFKTGGPADYLVTPDGTDTLKNIILLANREQTPYYIIGNGTNLLVSDEGYRGIVIITKDNRAEVTFEDKGEFCRVHSLAGCPLTRVAMEAARRGLTGLEFSAGIPGSLGGAVVMNAGAYGGEIRDCIVSAEVMTAEGRVITLSKEELELGYRHSCITERGLIVLSADFELRHGNTEEILATVSDLNTRRRQKQPLEFPSAGSTFKRPEGYFAGKLIEDSGLRGFSVGDAAVSEKHCGFVINRGHASSKDIITLIGLVSDKVFENFGVRLESEVRMLGFEN